MPGRSRFGQRAAADVHLGVQLVERRDAGLLAELGEADALLEIGLGPVERVFGVDEDRVAVN